MKLSITCLFLAANLVSLQAKTVFVTAGSGSPSAPYGSWSTAAADLQTALATAVAGDEIWVAAGTYFPDEGTGQTANSRSSTFALIEGVGLYGGFGGTETSLTQRDLNAHITILSGDLDQNDGPNFANNSNNAHHVVFVSIGGSTTVLDGFTLKAGNANVPSSGADTDEGGGLLCTDGSIICRNCSFTGNNADHGGGVALFGSSPSFTNCSFSGNRATGIIYGAKGGGLYGYAGSPSLTNCTFSGNFSAEFGGGICIESSGTFTLTNCSIAGNMAGTDSGGIYNDASAVSMTNSIVWNNSPELTDFDTPGASWASSHCLIQGKNLSAAPGGNLDGTLPANDPQFFIPGNPLSAPFTGGNLRLQPGSPAIDVGDGASGSSANTQAKDLAGKPRFINGADAAGTIAAAVIDLGAFEDNPLDSDDDHDGIADGTEVKLVSLGFGIGADDSAKLTLLQANAPALGLYTPANLQTLAVSRPVISRDPGTGRFQLRTQLLRSPDLVTPFVPFSAYTTTHAAGSSELLLDFAPPTPDAHFFQIQVGN